jgi:hypothetical protein
MQPLVSPFSKQPTNFKIEPEPVVLQGTFVLDMSGVQPIFLPSGRLARPRRIDRMRRMELEAELASYVEHMAGTPFDLDPALEAASIQHILSSDSDDE